MKALILAGGSGSRLNKITKEQNKCMLRFKNKPLVEYSLENAVRAGVKEIVLVVGYRATDIINYFGNKYNGIRIIYVIQLEQRGLVHAIECARGKIGDTDFILFLGDEILIKPSHQDMIRRFKEESLFIVCGVVVVDDISQIRKTYSIIQNNENNQVYRLIEKPRRPFNNIMGTGNCIFRNEIFEYIKYTPINQQRKEKELPDLIQCAVDDGKIVKALSIGDGYINVNTAEDLK